MSQQDEIAASLRKVLNSHGYGFQEAVKEYCFKLAQDSHAPWPLVLSECPVEVNGRHSRIDFILQRSDAWVVAECKRADPAKARWCFARATHTSYLHPPGESRPVVSAVRWPPDGRLEEQVHEVMTGNPYQVCREIRTGNKGEGVDAGGDLDKAISQAFRGVSGLIQELVRGVVGMHLPPNDAVALYPVVFTTAELWVTETPLSSADITTGDLESLNVAPINWLWYQENLSRDLRPKDVFLATTRPETGLARTVRNRSTRAAAIVNVLSIPSFLIEIAAIVGQLNQI